MEILVCVKRVPTVGGAITLTADGRPSIPGVRVHDQPARGVRGRGGRAARRAVRRSVTVVTLGPAEAARSSSARAWRSGRRRRCCSRPPDGVETGPLATAAALHAVAAAGAFDLVLLGNEASDTGDYQVGIRLAHLLGRPVATGIKAIRWRRRRVAVGVAASVPRGRGDLHAAAAVRGDGQRGDQPAALSVAARPAAGQAGGHHAGAGVVRCCARAMRMTALRVPGGRASQAGDRARARRRRGARPGRRCSRSSGCCHDGVLPGRSRRRRGRGRLAAGADPRARTWRPRRAPAARPWCSANPPAADLAAYGVDDVYVVSGIDGYAPQAWARALAGAGRTCAGPRWSRPGRTAATRCWRTWVRSPACRWRLTASRRPRPAAGGSSRSSASAGPGCCSRRRCSTRRPRC